MAASKFDSVVLRCALLTASLVVWATPSSLLAQSSPEPAAQVEFARPETFQDVGRANADDKQRAAYLDALGKHVAQRATRVLPPGQRLRVSITDVDMAGSFEPWRRAASGVRVVRNVHPARIALGFSLTAADGTVIKAGERILSDPMLWVPVTSYRSDPLRYEKALLDTWLDREFAAPGA